MGNYESREISLPIGQKVKQVINISPCNSQHQLDPSFSHLFRVLKNDNLEIDEMEGKISITETGATFTIHIYAPIDSIEKSGAISLDMELLSLRTEEMVGTPCMIRNRITIPYTITSIVDKFDENETTSVQDLSIIEITCKFN
jgi:hypothetical protein